MQSRKKNKNIATFSSVLSPLISMMSFHDSDPYCLANKTRHKCEVQLCYSAERRGSSGGGKDLLLRLQEGQWLPSCSHLYCTGIKRTQSKEGTQAGRSGAGQRLSAESCFSSFFLKKIKKTKQTEVVHEHVRLD